MSASKMDNAAGTIAKPKPKAKPYPFWLGGVAASFAGACTHPLDLTKVRMQTSGDKGMLKSIRKTVAAGGGFPSFFAIHIHSYSGYAGLVCMDVYIDILDRQDT